MRKLLLLISLVISTTSIFSQTWQEHNQKMLQLYKAGKFSEAIQSGEKGAEILKKDPNLIAEYAGLLNNLSFMYLKTKQYIKSEKSYLVVLSIIEPSLGNEHKITANVKNYLGEVYLKTNKLPEAEKYLDESFSARKKLLKISEPAFTQSLRNMKMLNIKKRDFEKAFQYMDEIISNMKELFGENGSNYLLALNEKALLFQESMQYKSSIELLDSLISKEIKLKGKNAENYLAFIQNKARALFLFDKFDEAIETYKEVCKIIEKKTGKNNNYAYNINQLGVTYFNKGLFSDAILSYNEAEKAYKNIYGETSYEYADVLNNKAVLYTATREFRKAENLYLKTKKIREETIGTNHPEYARTLNGLGVLYDEFGDYKKAEPLYLKGLEIYQKNKAENSRSYFTTLTNISALYENIGNYKESVKYYIKALDVGWKILGEGNHYYQKLLRKVASASSNVKEYKFSDSLFSAVLRAQQNNIGKMSQDYAITLNSIGVSYLERNKLKDAEKVLLEAKKIISKLYNKKHPLYKDILNNLALLYYTRNNQNKTEKNIIEANNILLSDIKENISFQTIDETEAYLKENGFLFDVYYSYYLIRNKDKPNLAGNAYNNALSVKGLMLQSEKGTKRDILKTNDSILIEKYNEFIKIKEKLGELYTSGAQTNQTKIKNLENSSKTIETELSRNSTSFNSGKNSKNINWLNVKNSLKQGEVAVEFINFNYKDLMYTDSIYYTALILRPGYKHPKQVFLFEERELLQLLKKEGYLNDHYYVGHLYHKTYCKQYGYKPKNNKISNALDSLIWKPIEAYLNDAEKIYISPSGLLHKISFSALSNSKKEFLSDKYKINIVSSTRQIVINSTKKEFKKTNVTLYGGIDYNALPENLTRIISRKYKVPTNESEIKHNPSYFHSLSRGESWTFLDGTLLEANSIESILMKSNIKVNLYKGENAVEESIKQYTDIKESPNLIHIATHGFFFPDPDKYKKTLKFGEGINKFKISQNPLFRSGLMFAGANRTWNNEEMPSNIDDGILTAYEVSNLNLENTELVVMSACETGLGDIKGSEGVYGLQRSFKLAGAEYVIMSLWQVPDEQTVDLMKQFYENRANGDNIEESFRKAQNELKKKYLPYYWAAFVLIK